MHLETKETARLYTLLSDKLGNDTVEAMFKYIDNKTERSVEASIKTLATNEDIVNLRKEFSESKAAIFEWMFIYFMGQIGAIIAIAMWFLYK